jgi:hypothetical protein
MMFVNILIAPNKFVGVLDLGIKTCIFFGTSLGVNGPIGLRTNKNDDGSHT